MLFQWLYLLFQVFAPLILIQIFSGRRRVLINSLTSRKEFFAFRNMNERLQVQNFGAIKELDLELKPIMVFIGEQGTGKSTIAKLISIFRSTQFLIEKAGTPREAFRKLLANHSISSYVNEKTQITFTSDYCEFRFSFWSETFLVNEEHPYSKADKEFSIYNQKFPDWKFDTPSPTKKLEDKKLEIEEAKRMGDHERVVELTKEIEETIEKNKYTDALLTRFEQMLSMQKYSEYIPSERIFISTASGLFMNLLSNKVPLSQSLLNFGAAFERARLSTPELDIDFLHIKYKFENGEDRIYFDDNQFINVKEAASGHQNIVPMLLVINNKTGISTNSLFTHTFIVEEPELGLFPTTQKELTKLLIKKCTSIGGFRGQNYELVMTTHSPYILSSLNNQLLAFKTSLISKNRTSEIDSIVYKDSWINPESFIAFEVKGGTARSIMNHKTMLISESELDSASEEINYDFDRLMGIYKGE